MIFARGIIAFGTQVNSSLPSSIHVVILFFVIVDYWWRWLLLFEKFFAIERTRRIQLQPRSDAVEIEPVVFVAGQLNNKRILVYAGE